MIIIIMYFTHIFGSHWEDPGGSKPGKCFICGKNIKVSKGS